MPAPVATRTPDRARRAALVAMLALLGCSEPQAQQSPPQPPSAEPVATGAATPHEGLADTASTGTADPIEITVEGGPFAGRYRVADASDLGCMVTPQPAGFQAIYAGTGEDQRGVAMVTARLHGVAAGGGSTDRVEFVVVFGEAEKPGVQTRAIGLGPQAPGSQGRGTVERSDDGAVVRVTGTTPDGARVSAVFRCDDVIG